MQNWQAFTDEELVEKYLEKKSSNTSELAFSELVTRYHGPLMRRIYSKLRRVDDSEEVLQEFWKDFARTVGRNYNPEQGRLKSWIYGVLHNKIVDFFRRRRNDKSPLLPGEEGEVWPEEWPGDILQAMEKCLHSFPPKYGRILCFLLVSSQEEKGSWPQLSESTSSSLPFDELLEGRELEDLSETLSRPMDEFIAVIEKFTGEKPLLATAKTWKHRALNLLQECLNRQGFGT